MSTIFIERTVNLNGPIIPDTLTGVLNCGEVDSHEFTISATLDNDPFAMSGVVTASFIRSDGVTVPLTGSISDGAAVVVLNNLCYNVPGRFAFTVFITSEGVTTAIYGCTGTVRQTVSGSIVDPGEIIPSVSGLITAIENAIAEIPADYSQLLATQAPTFSPSTPYVVGSYVWYDGTLYRFTAAHAAGSWTGSDATAVTIGGELADLKSAMSHDLKMITEETANIFNETYFLNAEGWTYEEGTDSFTGVLKHLSNYAAVDGYPGLSFSAGKRYTITFYAKISGSTTTGYGLAVRFVYTDSTYDHVRVENNTSSFTKFTLTSASGKTVSKLVMTYSSGANNICWIKDVTLAEGVSENNDPYRMPVDAIARNGVAKNVEKIQEVQKNALTIGTPYNTYAPEAFTWQNNPLKGKIRTDFKGTVEVDYDVSVNDPTESGVTYYVDPVNGESTNSGLTPDDAFGKMATALEKSDVSCIMLKGGVYASTLNLANDPIQKTIAIKAMEGENVVIAQAIGSTLTADTDHPGTYYGSRGNCYGIVDMKYQNSEGDPVEYVNASDVLTVYSTPGSWILTGGTFYLHTLDGREQDEDLLCFRSGNNLVAEGNITLYLENLKVYGGSVPLKATAQAGTDQLKVYAKNCDFYYPYTANDDCVQMQGTTISIFQNCRAKYGKKDGFNYHVAEGIVPKAIEIGCEGAYCGNIEDANDQGSTIHDGGSAIRVNCLYHHNQGSNVADETAGTEAWMIGCVAFNSLAVNAGQNANYFTYDGVKFWMESCVGFGSTNNLYMHNSESQIALRNCRLEGKLAPSGQTPIYY